MSDLIAELENLHTDIDDSVEQLSVEEVKQQVLVKTIPLNKEGNSELKNKFNMLYNLYVLGDNNRKQQLATVSFAKEVFTMLPLITKQQEAKLTSSASSSNKELIDSIITKEINEIDYTELENKIDYIYDIIKQHSPDFIGNSLSLLYSELDTYLEAIVNKKIMIIKRTSEGPVACNVLDLEWFGEGGYLLGVAKNSNSYSDLQEALYTKQKFILVDNSDTIRTVIDNTFNLYSNFISRASIISKYKSLIDTFKTATTDKLKLASELADKLDEVIDSITYIKDLSEYLKGPNILQALCFFLKDLAGF